MAMQRCDDDNAGDHNVRIGKVALVAFGVDEKFEVEGGSSGCPPLPAVDRGPPSSMGGNREAKTTNGINVSSLLANLCHYFSFEEIQAATQDFDESLILGVGRFRKVYLGEIDDGTVKVTIKHGNSMSEQGIHEFQTEIGMLSKP
ncbi:hypothetical protein ZIOFF_008264 [Zingiber officinale]|uniref:Uncharacterized protein n=1 Tax=Zingiber officinale TaxID=94328 RepID=A0A8J5HSF1_ZINOF|nr:hypothetical protein ZIOFF_008264 [Zingiber officinale]